MKITTTRRKYHVYKFASQTLKILEHELSHRQKIVHDHLDKSSHKKLLTSTIFKEIKKNKPLQDLRHVKDVLEAAQNIIGLCDQAYDVCQETEIKGRAPEMDEMLVAFLEVTNEMYPCVKKELLDKMLIKTK